MKFSYGIAAVLTILTLVGCFSKQPSVPAQSSFNSRYEKLNKKYKAIANDAKQNIEEDNLKKALFEELQLAIKNELNNGRRIETNTSAGANYKYYNNTIKLLNFLKEMAKNKKPLQSIVKTHISTNLKENHIVRYLTYKEYKNHSEEGWRTYNNGMDLQIQTYMFKVSLGERFHIEPVLIWDNPTELTIKL